VAKVARKKKSVKKKPASARKAGAADLLVELGTEELPPRSLLTLSRAFASEMQTRLLEAGLLAGGQEVEYFAAPRRLAVRIPGVLQRQPDRDQERRGPAVQAAFDAQGKPSQAAEGFARSCGTSVDKLERLKTDKGEWLVYRHRQKGEAARQLVPAILDQALKALPIAKRMRWGDLDAEFLRPVHWLVLLHGDKVIPAELLSVKSGRHSRGHRFHHPEPVSLKHPGEYVSRLKQGYVMVDFESRRQLIGKAASKLAAGVQGKALIDEKLLDEVTSLVEWPVPLLGEFEKKYLDVPAEALITTMQDNQKYFPVVNRSGRLLPYFITVSNIRSKQKRKVVEGNERVIRARFSDAGFFWDSDRKVRLESHIDKLRDVVFHNKLGTLHDKVERVSKLAAIVADELNTDTSAAQWAGMLSKADLMTGMVAEFPELQGVMGRYYAAHDGEPEEVAMAMEEQYLPRFAGDRLPVSGTGNALAIADKIDTIVGIFSAGDLPTGDKDPFGLRRAALGVLRIAIENRQGINLWTVLRSAAVHFAGHDTDRLSNSVYDFMMDRLRTYYVDAGVPRNVFEAVLACRPQRPLDFDGRIRAVQAFGKMKEAESLSAANKRIGNILKQAGDRDWDHVSTEMLSEAAEKQLARKIDEMQSAVKPLFDAGDYTAALKQLARLRPEVDQFFDRVMVMVDEQAVRDNRLALLQKLRNLFLRVADLSCLQEH
jgi:glycyl-tRNA synthetase beta chain